MGFVRAREVKKMEQKERPKANVQSHICLRQGWVVIKYFSPANLPPFPLQSNLKKFSLTQQVLATYDPWKLLSICCTGILQYF